MRDASAAWSDEPPSLPPGAAGGVLAGAHVVARVVAYTGLIIVLLAVAGSLRRVLLPSTTAGADLWVEVTATLLAAAAAAWILLRVVDRAPFATLGLSARAGWPGGTGVGFGVGAGLLVTAVALIVVAGGVHWVRDDGTTSAYLRSLGGSLLLFTVAAASEEVLFRGYPLQVMTRYLGPVAAVVLSSAVFALAHGSNPNVQPLGLVNIFAAGVLLAVAVLVTRSLWFAVGVHAGWNWAMSGLLDFPVSGLTFDTPLYTAVETGADWWTGGAFGPEAGLPATLVLSAGTVWMATSRRLRPAARSPSESPPPTAEP